MFSPALSEQMADWVPSGNIVYTVSWSCPLDTWDEVQFAQDCEADWGISFRPTNGRKHPQDILSSGETDTITWWLHRIPLDNNSCQLILTVHGARRSYLEVSRMFVRLSATIAKYSRNQDFKIGNYRHDPKRYREMAFHYEKENEFPLLNLVSIHVYSMDGATICGYTRGLERFSKHNLEILSSHKSPAAVKRFLADVAYYLLTEDAEFKTGDTVGFTEDEKINVICSPGLAIGGVTAKLNYGNVSLRRCN